MTLSRPISNSDVSPLNDTTSLGFWSNVNGTPRIHRVRDRVFVGAAVDMHDTTSNNNNTWLSSLSVGASWALRDSQFVVLSDRGQMAVTGISRSSDAAGIGTTIGLSGIVINDVDNRTVWGLYSDVQVESGTGRTGWGVELAVKNKGANQASTPYTASGPYGACGLWLPAGGDGTYGGSAANPNNFAIGVKGFGSTWNTGLLFLSGSLTLDGSNYGTAIHMAAGHRVVWSTSGQAAQAAIWLDPAVGAGSTVSAMMFGSGLVQTQAGGKAILNMTGGASNVNHWTLSAVATGQQPTLAAEGDDTNIYANIQGKGSQGVLLRDGAGGIKVRVNTAGVGFQGATEVAKQTLSSALATDGSATNAAMATAINALRSGLINYGLCQ